MAEQPHLTGMPKIAALALALALGACAGIAPTVVDQSRMPANGLGAGSGDADVAAVELAQWAFADSGRTYGRPIEAARAAAAMDYLAGQLYSSPRWQNISATTKEQLLEGRREVRAALGVAPGVKSQQIVDSLTAAGNALAAGDQPGAVARLGAPVFTGTGEQVLARLSNMPYLRMANVATMKAANELFRDDLDRSF